jgi:uncharacterized protein YjiS (DUF1127 family)
MLRRLFLEWRRARALARARRELLALDPRLLRDIGLDAESLARGGLPRPAEPSQPASSVRKPRRAACRGVNPEPKEA